MDGLPLGPGSAGEPASSGEAVRDLQRRLTSLGLDVDPAEYGRYGPATEQVVQRFQEQKGLHVTGVCDVHTWSALIEAGYRLGDRLLYHRSPMLRGDDVAELQLRLGALGFDTGRVDGIFGPRAEQAVKDFERNAGLTTDGVCGRDVIAALARLGSRDENATTVAGVREREALRDAPRALSGRRIAVGTAGGLDVVAAALRRGLQDTGAIVVELTHPDPSVQAGEANRFDADVFVGIGAHESGPCRVHYYATRGFESSGGRRLAALVGQALVDEGGLVVGEPSGMRLPVLRETRMPAVMCYLGPAATVVTASTRITEALAEAVVHWVADPIET